MAGAPIQFHFNSNSDFPPSSPAVNPPEFPPADPIPCARITTRVFHPKQSQVATVPNVLVRTRMPSRRLRGGDEDAMNDDDSSSSSSSDNFDDAASRMDEDDDDDDNAPQAETATTTATTTIEEERAYWMQRTVREAIYGRVVFAVVLRRRRAAASATKAPSQDNLPNAEWEVTDEHCAIKEMSWQHIRRERDHLAEDPIKEVSAMQYLKKWHERARAKSEGNNISQYSSSFAAVMDTNIMMPLDLLSDDRHLYSIMPYCDGGELFDLLDVNEKFSEGEARYWMHQILNGIENLQHAGICHRDMSLENLLVHQNGALIIDMGMCLRIPYSRGGRSISISETMNDMSLSAMPTNGGDSTSTMDSENSTFVSGRSMQRLLMTPQGTCGKWIYMSPEIYRNRDPFDGFAIDMWAAGVILFLMLTGFPPWEKACGTDDRFRYMTAGYLVQMLTEWDVGLSSDAMDLLQRMLFKDPADRLSLDQVRAHPWMVNGPRTAPASLQQR